MDGMKRQIYLSPHFDDAVYSCGGLINAQARRGLSAEVWTVCSGDPPPGPLSPQAERMQREWGSGSAAETVALRRGEDRKALGLVGAAGRSLGIPDCIYRRSAQGGLLYPDRWSGECNPLEAGLVAQLAAVLADLLLPEDELACPLAVGGHIDHRLTRDAAELLGRPLHYYPEVPYLFNYPEEFAAATQGMRADLHPVPQESLDAWLAGIAAYASQLGVQFQDEGRMRTLMREYWERQRGLQLWMPT
jgi:LmbE family N-acetylglucosaminyl deacetylase